MIFFNLASSKLQSNNMLAGWVLENECEVRNADHVFCTCEDEVSPAFKRLSFHCMKTLVNGEYPDVVNRAAQLLGKFIIGELIASMWTPLCRTHV